MQNLKGHYGLLVLILGLALGVVACESKPKVIEAKPTTDANQQPIFNTGTTAPAAGEAAHNHPPMEGMQAGIDPAEHTVKALEALHTEKYSYLRVQENDAEHWIAIPKTDVKIGSKYVYRGGLVKANFQSKEYNRVFEKLILVSDFRPFDASAGAATATTGSGKPAANAVAPPTKAMTAAGAVKLSDLLANPAKYKGKTITVTGKCVKYNPMIMGKNWLHIHDGSGKEVDLTITTAQPVELGANVTCEGVITLDKDFGAGYKYAIIMEDAVVK